MRKTPLSSRQRSFYGAITALSIPLMVSGAYATHLIIGSTVTPAMAQNIGYIQTATTPKSSRNPVEDIRQAIIARRIREAFPASPVAGEPVKRQQPTRPACAPSWSFGSCFA